MAIVWDDKKDDNIIWDDGEDANAAPGGMMEALGSPRRAMGMMKSLASRREPGVDYFTGVQSGKIRGRFSEMDTEEERDTYLNKTFGEKNWRSDQYGALVIQPKGLEKIGQQHKGFPVAFDEQGSTRYDFADIKGDAPTIAGAMAGGIATGGLGFLPAVGLTALTAAGGKGFQETWEALWGRNQQSAKEVAIDIGKEGAWTAVGEGVFRGILRPLGRKLMAPEAKRVSKGAVEMMREAKRIGAKANVTQITKAPILGRTQSMINRIFGDPDMVNNSRAIHRELGRLKLAAGPKTAMAREPADDVIKDIIAKRTRFAGIARVKYHQVDQVVGGKKVIPTVSLKGAASKILEEVPLDKAGKPSVLVKPETIKFMKGINDLPDYVSAQEMQAIRNRFFDAMYSGDLVPGLEIRHARSFYKAAGASYDDAVEFPAPDITKKEMQLAIAKLTKAKSFYAKGIRQFDDNLIAKITRDPRKASAIDPDVLVETIFKPGHPGRVAKVMKLVKPETRDLLRRRAMENITDRLIERTDDPLATFFNGKKFLGVLDGYGKETLNEMFGKELTRELYRLGNVTQFVGQKMAMSGGLVAAHISLHPIQNMPRLFQLKILQKIMHSEAGLRWLTTGIQAPKTRAGAEALSRLTVYVQTLADQETGVAEYYVGEPPTPEQMMQQQAQ